MPQSLLIVGASGRAAAFSALRAGCTPVVIDYFADADLASMATVHRCDPADFPRSAIAAADNLPPMPWLYCGGVENQPELIERISGRHGLAGIATDRLPDVRDPIRLATRLRGLGVAVPRTVPLGDPVTSSGRWLVKPAKSAGGIGVRRLNPADLVAGAAFVAQEFHEGPTIGALYLASDRDCETIGVCQQFAGDPAKPDGFHYRGGVGPVPLAPDLSGSIDRVGQILRSDLGMRGLFGADFVVDDGRPVLIEVNPRPTASVELLEHATGRPLLAEHLRVFGLVLPIERRDPRALVGKRIVYADASLEIPGGWDWSALQPATLDLPRFADLPSPLTRIGPGEPLLTVLASGESIPSCVSELNHLEKTVTKMMARFER